MPAQAYRKSNTSTLNDSARPDIRALLAVLSTASQLKCVDRPI